MKHSVNYPVFVSYFNKRIKPALKDYVIHAAQLKDIEPNWTNNNCESLNHIMKLDAKWKPGTTPLMIDLLHDIATLHFKDFRRALYGGGNYGLVKNQKKRFGISKDMWRKLNEEERLSKFSTFLKNECKQKSTTVKLTYANFVVTKPLTARIPGQKKRVRVAKSVKK